MKRCFEKAQTQNWIENHLHTRLVSWCLFLKPNVFVHDESIRVTVLW
jgi:hypothetical protein